MSYNNNISHTLGGIFRSMSRRNRRSGVETEGSNAQQRADVDMDSQRSSLPTFPHISENTATLNNEDGNQSDSSMPALQNVSDSEVESDTHSLSGDMDLEYIDTGSDYGRAQANRTHNLASHRFPVVLPDADEDMPSLESLRPRTQGTRRARVEDDVDGDSERDRRHPSQRVFLDNTLTPSLASGRSTPPALPIFPNFIVGGRHRRRHRQQNPPVHLAAYIGMDAPGESNPPSSNSAEAQINNPPESRDQPTGATTNPANRYSQILESLFLSAGEGPTIHTVVDGAPVAGEVPIANGGPGRLLGNLLAAMNTVDGGTFSINSESFAGGFPFFTLYPQERDDPERAKILVEGLEDVPVGLVRRLQRISPESSGCAICWENLLEDDAEYLKRESEEAKKITEDAAKADSIDPTFNHDSQATGSSAEFSSSSSSFQRSIPKYPRVVTLPCTHVFHADCLIPWFTRPNQTTCPTCRFNIDPDNLTRGAGVRRAAATAGVGGESASVSQRDDAASRDTQLDGSFSVDSSDGMSERASDEALPPGATASVGIFRVVGGAHGGDTVVPIPPTPLIESVGSTTNSFPWDPSNWPRTALDAQSSTPLGGSTSTSNPSADTPSDSSSSSSSIPSSVNDEEGIRDSMFGETASIRREDLRYPNAPRLPRARNESSPPRSEQRPSSNVTEEQLRNFTQNILSRLFNAEAILTASQPNTPAANQEATGSRPASSPNNPSLIATNDSGDSVPHTHPHPQAEHHRHHHHLHHHPGDGYVTIGFNFIIGPDIRPPGSRPASIGRDRAGSTRPSAPNMESRSFVQGIPMRARQAPDSANDLDTFNDGHPGPLGETDSSSSFQPNHSTSTSQTNTLLPFFLTEPAVTPAPNQQSEATGGGSDRRSTMRAPNLSNYISSMLGAASGIPRPRPNHRSSYTSRERRQWVPPPPPPPGFSLRQTIEKREREAGLRCWDVSCGVGPADEDPTVTISEGQRRQVRIRRLTAVGPREGDIKGKGKEKAEEPTELEYACEHSFHPPCIVSAQRASLNGSPEVIVEDGKYIEVSCTVCRAPGMLPREDWEEGVRVLEI